MYKRIMKESNQDAGHVTYITYDPGYLSSMKEHPSDEHELLSSSHQTEIPCFTTWDVVVKGFPSCPVN